jgi:signal transduction histidine kinase
MTEQLRILLVEDDPDDRELILREMKREFPFARVITAHQPESFEAALEGGEFDAVILDWQLGWSDGTSLMKAIKSRFPHRPVVMYSGMAHHEDAVAATRAGLDEFVFKSPESVTRLPGTVRAVMRLAQHQRKVRGREQLAIVGRLASSVAHEISHPLESLSNLLYLLSKADTENKDELLQAATEQLHHLEEIADRSLGFSRQSSEPAEVVISHLLNDVLSLYRYNFEELGLQVALTGNSSEPIRVYAAEIKQLASNLVSNALDVLPRRGRLALRVRESRDWANLAQKGIRITVADNGPGMSSEAKSHLFEPFFTTKGENGTGLGLWVSRGIVRSHGGTISVRSSTAPGRSGTCFSIFLPRSTAGSAQAA